MNIRDRIAIRLFWLATAIGCGGIKRMSKTVVDFSSVMGEQMELGRTGGIVIIPWYTDELGRLLALKQQTQATEIANHVRTRFDAQLQKVQEDAVRTVTEEV